MKYLSVYTHFVYLFVYNIVSTYSSTYLFTNLSTNLFTYLSNTLCTSFCQSTMCLPICVLAFVYCFANPQCVYLFVYYRLLTYLPTRNASTCLSTIICLLIGQRTICLLTCQLTVRPTTT